MCACVYRLAFLGVTSDGDHGLQFSHAWCTGEIVDEVRRELTFLMSILGCPCCSLHCYSFFAEEALVCGL